MIVTSPAPVSSTLKVEQITSMSDMSAIDNVECLVRDSSLIKTDVYATTPDCENSAYFLIILHFYILLSLAFIEEFRQLVSGKIHKLVRL